MASTSRAAPTVKVRRAKKKKFIFLRKIGAGVCLLALVVMLTSGFLAGVPLVTTAFRASLAVICVLLIQRVLLGVLSTYEEIDRGKA